MENLILVLWVGMRGCHKSKPMHGLPKGVLGAVVVAVLGCGARLGGAWAAWATSQNGLPGSHQKAAKNHAYKNFELAGISWVE